MPNWLLAALVAGTLLALALSLFVAARSVPVRVRSDAQLALQIAERLRADWTVQLVDLDKLREAIEGQLASVEKKRRQTAAAASRANRDRDQEPEEQPEPAAIRDHQQLRLIARSRGMLT